MAVTEVSTLGRRAPDLPETMRAAVFRGRERILLEEVPVPACGPADAIVKITLTTICGRRERAQHPIARVDARHEQEQEGGQRTQDALGDQDRDRDMAQSPIPIEWKKNAKACSGPDTRLSSVCGTTNAIASVPRIDTATISTATRKMARG